MPFVDAHDDDDHMTMAANAELTLNIAQIRTIIHEQKQLLNSIQPLNRSFSHPEIYKPNLVDGWREFREKFLGAKFFFPQPKADSQSDDFSAKFCDNLEPPPIPLPRKSVGKKKKVPPGGGGDHRPLNNCDMNNGSANGLHESGSNLTNGLCSKSVSLNSVQPNLPDMARLAELKLGSYPSMPMPTKIKMKNSFRSFLRINKIANNKFLSLRINKYRSKKQNLGEQFVNYRPQRPTRTPPEPPVLTFRPPAPPPPDIEDGHLSLNSDSGHFTHSSLRDSGDKSLLESIFECDTISELYHDAMNPEDAEAIYWSVDEELSSVRKNLFGQTNLYDSADDGKGCGENTGGSSGSGEHYDDYYDDGECIYEQLSSSDGTIYEEYDENLYDNATAVAEAEDKFEDKKQLKRLKKVRKMMERFNLTGDEIPINAGIIKEDNKGSKQDLLVKQGETVLILRMKDNPPGKWLAKNERSKIGFVDLDNVYFDTESIKAVIQSLHAIT